MVISPTRVAGSAAGAAAGSSRSAYRTERSIRGLCEEEGKKRKKHSHSRNHNLPTDSPSPFWSSAGALWPPPLPAFRPRCSTSASEPSPDLSPPSPGRCSGPRGGLGPGGKHEVCSGLAFAISLYGIAYVEDSLPPIDFSSSCDEPPSPPPSPRLSRHQEGIPHGHRTEERRRWMEGQRRRRRGATGTKVFLCFL